MNRDEILQDKTVKLIGIPLLGVCIPNFSRIIVNAHYTPPQLLLCYAYFILDFIYCLAGQCLVHVFHQEKIRMAL